MFEYIYSVVSIFVHSCPMQSACLPVKKYLMAEAAEFLCQNCQFERTFCPAGTNFRSGKILSRRPRIIRGFCLSKEPLQYQKSPTCFRFSFQKPDEQIYTNGEPKLLTKKVIFSMGMTTGLCNMQARSVMQRQRSLFHVREGKQRCHSELEFSY